MGLGRWSKSRANEEINMKKLDYCLFCGPEMEPKDKMVMSGLFAWGEVFKQHGGKYEFSPNLTREAMEQWDIIHTNYTSGNPSYLAAIRKVLGWNSSTLVVANVDHALLMHGTMDPWVAKQMLNLADMVFCVEEKTTAKMEDWLERKVYCIPHPVAVDEIAKYRLEIPEVPVLSCQHHRYFNTWDPYFYVVQELKKREWNVRAVLQNFYLDGRPPVAINAMFDDVLERTDYPSFIKRAAESAWNFDLTPDYTFGRGIVDFAALDIPTVGSKSISAMRRIWPELAFDYSDIRGMVKAFEKLFGEPDFCQRMTDQGNERAKYYDFAHSYKRMKKAIEETRDEISTRKRG